MFQKLWAKINPQPAPLSDAQETGQGQGEPPAGIGEPQTDETSFSEGRPHNRAVVQQDGPGAGTQIDGPFSSAQSPQATARVALELVDQELDYDRASVVVFDLESGIATVLATQGHGDSQLDHGATFPLQHFDLQELLHNRIRTVDDIKSLDPQTGTDRLLYDQGIHSYSNVPLFALGQLVGSLNLGWAEPGAAARADLEIVEQMAGTLAVALEQAQPRERLQDHALRKESHALALARSNDFITALSQVAIRLQTVRNPQRVMEALGQELRAMSLNCMICLLDPDGQALVIRYTSMDSAILRAGQRLLGTDMIGYRMPRDNFGIWSEVIEEKRAVLNPDILSMMGALLPGILRPTLTLVLRMGGSTPDIGNFWLPLVVGQRALGAMSVWGTNLLDTDVLPATIFAGQVAIALENSRLFDAERQRAKELARTSEQLHQELEQRRQAEETLKRYSTELERSNQELQQFAYVASHDLQEPLRMVTSYLQLLQSRYQGQLDADADDFIHFAVDGAARMHELIQGLLAYSRISTTRQPLETTACEMALAQALNNLQITVKESHAEVTHDPLPEVMADPTQMTQLLQNLIGNALKFRGERAPHVHVGAKRLEDEWLFSVRDNGIGIEADYAQRIFVIFQRLHTREEYQGTGIGLSICKRIVERHGGRIWVESEPGTGSTFFFTIPDKA